VHDLLARPGRLDPNGLNSPPPDVPGATESSAELAPGKLAALRDDAQRLARTRAANQFLGEVWVNERG
jgi:hypothetical protein